MNKLKLAINTNYNFLLVFTTPLICKPETYHFFFLHQGVAVKSYI